MSNIFGLFGQFAFLGIIEILLRLMTYIAVICVCFKAVQALNIYINRNSR